MKISTSFASFAALALTASVASADAPRAVAVDEGVRVKHDEPIGSQGAASVRLEALRDETVAFQVVVTAGSSALTDVTLDVDPIAGQSGPPITVDRFVERFTRLARRSFNSRRPLESLGWNPKARPSDASIGADLPDALIPVDLAPRWEPYPSSVPARENGAFWIDVAVPTDATPGRYTSLVRVAAGGREIATLPLTLDVKDATLPYRPVSFLVYYGKGELDARIGDGDRAEKQLLQLFHAHHIDAFMTLDKEEDVDRLRSALDGSLFTATSGYRGPGVGVAPAAVAIGAYGSLYEPDKQSLAKVTAIVPKIPKEVRDVMLYAVDEDCESDVPPKWKAEVAKRPEWSRVKVAMTCSHDPRHQPVDLVMVTSNDFRTNESDEARALGKSVWVYNGELPRSGPLLVDAPFSSLRADAWIAATHDVGRWFLWESTFWNDDNSGGKGAIDPFVTYESFHNKHGDTANGDGLLVYPGTQKGKFAEHSADFAGVFPSMRLKSLRRGIEDAGYLALARANHPSDADVIASAILPAALDEIKETAKSALPDDAASLAQARTALRALIEDRSSLADDDAARVLREGARKRAEDHAESARDKKLALGGGLFSIFAALGFVFVRRRRAK